MSIIRNKVALAFLTLFSAGAVPRSSGRSPRRDGPSPAAAAACPLLTLRRGQQAEVLHLDVESGLRHRLQALGLKAGQRVQVLRRAPWGGPIHLQVGMTELMLRRRDAARIAVAASDAVPTAAPDARP